MPEGIRLSWNRDHEGVITIYATDLNTGRVADVADLWVKPMCDRLNFRREYALSVQQCVAETLCEAWNEREAADA